ncbi:MAG: class I SAM-dependent methyltransferase [Clostridia bacterium]|nr:class I SAM-dependent methyltransferase [Clostridia bacterium]
MHDILKQWEQAAGQFAADQEGSEYADANKSVVRHRFQRFNGESVLDLGCGYGYYTDYFDGIGARTVGIDGAEAMIRIARERYPNSAFALADLADPLPFEDASFDLIFCNQVLMDVEGIEDIFHECRRVLKNRGILYYSIVHPAFYSGSWLTDENGRKYAKAVSRYLRPYVFQNHFGGETAHFHRPLSAYLNAAANAGFHLVRAQEPRSYDGVVKNDDLPLFFFAEYEK